MATLEFQDLRFKEENNSIKIIFLKYFYTFIKKQELKKIGNFIIDNNSIIFSKISEKSAERKFNMLLLKAFENLKNIITGKKTIYIHKNSGIPLIGNISFGIIDRDTNLIELRPLTICNLDCIYCSVDSSKRLIDYVVEKDYLVEEVKKIIEFKENNDIEININPQGEPLLYEPLEELIRDLKNLKQVKRISIDTNGTLLTKERIDNLVKAGLTHLNLSLNALDQKIAEKMANRPYNVKKILEIAKYCSKKLKLRLSPVWLPGYNDNGIEKIILFAKSINASLGIQNFLNYKFGKNPVKQMPFDEFYKKLRELEKKHNVKLILTREDCSIRKTKPLPRPLKKGQIIKAKIMLQGRLKNEKIAVFNNRTIAIPNCFKNTGETAKIRITKTNHNIFIGELF